MLSKFGIDKLGKPVTTSLIPRFKLSSYLAPDTEKELKFIVLHASVVGSLMYAIVYIRSDISHVINIISKYMHNPGKGY